MKELTQYQCEICHTIYNTQEACGECEASHVGVYGIDALRYLPVNQSNHSAYPHVVTLLMHDGTRVTYKR